jgi:predicted phosphodiesterase
MFSAQNEHKNLTAFRQIGEIKLAGKTIGFTHFPDRAKNMAESGAYDFVFYGHSHTPWIEKICSSALDKRSQRTRHPEFISGSHLATGEILKQVQNDDSNKQCCLLLNPGEIASHFGRQSTFAIVNLETSKAELKIIV